MFQTTNQISTHQPAIINWRRTPPNFARVLVAMQNGLGDDAAFQGDGHTDAALLVVLPRAVVLIGWEKPYENYRCIMIYHWKKCDLSLENGDSSLENGDLSLENDDLSV